MMAIKMMRSRKGAFFIFVSSILVLVLLLVFSVYNSYQFSDEQDVVETRISTLNDFIKDIETDSDRVIYVSGYRSLIALEDYVATTGSYINDSEEFFKIAFYNGTVNGTKVEVLNASSYGDYLDKLRLVSHKIGIDVFLNVTDITLYQESPWSVIVVVSTYVYVNDTRGLAHWSFTKDYSTEIPLRNIRDPVYSVGTLGKVTNIINRTDILEDEFVVGILNDTTGLKNHSYNSLYKNSTLAPSFLMRLEGNFSPSPYGIESFVNLTRLGEQDAALVYNSKSLIDYIYFSNLTGFEVMACNVENMASDFKIDLNHTLDYELYKLNFTECS